MSWDKNEEEAFPARHPREPGGLRQDILDEIADHLACAAAHERERDNEGTEESIWDRVLERFGNPDAVARRLWWDQMKEIVMREWIQTGVQVVLAVVGVAGIFLLFMVMGRMQSANDAMQQIAESNRAVMEALAEQRAENASLLQAVAGLNGGTASTEELSTITITLRRGSEDGPPAPNVDVTFSGKGPGEQSLRLEPELDAEGRATFERLYQGEYHLIFYDPQSELYADTRLTLFAGQGGGEYVYVVPDVTPRPVHIDWGLPAYGPEQDLRIGTTLQGTVEAGELTWEATTGVVSGRGETIFAEEERIRDPSRPRVRTPGRLHLDDSALSSPQPCELSGELTLGDALFVLKRDPGSTPRRPSHDQISSGDWVSIHQVIIGGNVATRPGESVARPEFVDAGDGIWRATLPDKLVTSYARAAREIRNLESAYGREHETIAELASRYLESDRVVDGEVVSARRHAQFDEHRAFKLKEGYENSVLSGLSPGEGYPENVSFISLPAGPLGERETDTWLLVATQYERKWKVTRDGSEWDEERVNGMEGNELAAYFIRSSWQDGELAPFSPDSGSTGSPVTIDDEPFWTRKSEDVRDVAFIKITEKVMARGDSPPTGVMLRWRHRSEEYVWGLIVVDEFGGEGAPVWLFTEPLESERPDRPLDNIDGRFHYDSIRGRDVELTPSGGDR